MSKLLTLHDPAAARRLYDSGVWRDDTLYALLCRHAAARPDAFALRDATRRLTYGALKAWVDALAADLDAAGLRSGDRIGVWLPNRVEAVVVFLACNRQGYVCNASLHHNYRAGQIVELMREIDAKALITRTGHGADGASVDLYAALRALPSLSRIYRIDANADARRPGEAAFPAADAKADALPAANGNPDRVIYLAFTSGTTGKPKGVMHSDNTLLANARPMVADWGLDATTVLLSLSPMSHHIGTVALAQILVAGGELVVDDRAKGESALDWIAESGATYVMGVPTHAMDLLAEMRRRKLDALGRVKTFYMAGAPIPTEIAEGFLALNVTPQNVYGMTENGSHQYTLPSDDVRTIVETCGRANAGFEVRIVDAENPDRDLAPGAVGEIASRGGNLMLGYFNNQSATEASFNRSGWFLSGDLGSLDERGCLRIYGRKKDLIIRGGHNIYPAEIEDLALRHPGIAKAAAFAIADERLGEKVCLAVIAAHEEDIEAEAVLAHLHAAGLSKYDMPEYFIALAAFPLTPSGKILKRELVEWAKSGRIRPAPVRWRGESSEPRRA